MLKLFGGMIIGSMITMILLGGASVADQVTQRIQTLAQAQAQEPGSLMSLYLLVGLAFLLVHLAGWRTKPSSDHTAMIKQLRRHCADESTR